MSLLYNIFGNIRVTERKKKIFSSEWCLTCFKINLIKSKHEHTKVKSHQLRVSCLPWNRIHFAIVTLYSRFQSLEMRKWVRTLLWSNGCVTNVMKTIIKWLRLTNILRSRFLYFMQSFWSTIYHPNVVGIRSIQLYALPEKLGEMYRIV